MIRPYEPGDVRAVVEAWAAASAIAHPFLSVDFLATERHNVEHVYLQHGETWVWEEGGRVVGFIAMLGEEIGGLFLHPDFHGRGIGRRLVDSVREGREALELEVFEKNAIGRSFYDRYGFELVEEKLHEPTGERLLRLRLPL